MNRIMHLLPSGGVIKTNELLRELRCSLFIYVKNIKIVDTQPGLDFFLLHVGWVDLELMILLCDNLAYQLPISKRSRKTNYTDCFIFSYMNAVSFLFTHGMSNNDSRTPKIRSGGLNNKYDLT